LARSILRGFWRFNGETIIVSRSGLVLSGQHRLIALILAFEEWSDADNKNYAHWQEMWPEEPYIESLILVGAPEDQETINTLDNVRTRSLSDVFYTSELFAHIEGRDNRKKASMMLASAVIFLYRRVVLSSGKEVVFDPQIHPASIEFLHRHLRLLEFIVYMMELDSGNELTDRPLALSAGKCAAMLYLMASSDSNPGLYRVGDAWNEENLNWDMEEKAKSFWEHLAGKHATFVAIKDTFHDLKHHLTGKDPKFIDKVCVLAKAWAKFRDDEVIEVKGITPKYDTDEHTQVKKLVDWPTFNNNANGTGIDSGEPKKGEPADEPQETEQSMDERMKKAGVVSWKERIKNHNKAVREGRTDNGEND
jgi:hypothetical protein